MQIKPCKVFSIERASRVAIRNLIKGKSDFGEEGDDIILVIPPLMDTKLLEEKQSYNKQIDIRRLITIF